MSAVVVYKVNALKEAETRASFCVAHSLPKHKEYFIDSELIKDCMITTAEGTCPELLDPQI